MSEDSLKREIDVLSAMLESLRFQCSQARCNLILKPNGWIQQSSQSSPSLIALELVSRRRSSTKLSGDGAFSIGCEYCPRPSIDVDGGFFVRAVVGLGFGLGVTARGDYKVNLDDPLSWKNLKGAVSIGSAGEGVSIDVGGVVTVDFAIKKIR